MLNVFPLANGRLFQEEIESPAALAGCKPLVGETDAPTTHGKRENAPPTGRPLPNDPLARPLAATARLASPSPGRPPIPRLYSLSRARLAAPYSSSFTPAVNLSVRSARSTATSPTGRIACARCGSVRK